MDERRYYGLDALRGFMMMLGIALHAAVLYLESPPPHLPLTSDRNTSVLMDVLVDFIHVFRMPTFFVLAGFFASLLVEKRGVWGTYRNRVARILAPLLAGIVTVLPLSLLFMLDFILSVKYGAYGILPQREDIVRLQEEVRAKGVPEGFFLGHLWFLYYLCYFYLLIPVCRWLVAVGGPAQGRLGRVLASPLAMVALSLASAAMLWPYPGAQVFGEFVFLAPHPPSLLFYGAFFVFGYLLHFHRGFLPQLARRVPVMAALALVLVPLALLATQIEYADPARGFDVHLFAVLSHGFATWTLIFLFIGGALRFFDYESAWILYISQSSYWVFLLHMPVVCLVAWWLVPYDLPALLKFSIVVTTTLLLCVATYHYWVQGTWMGAFLNGRRFGLDWPWRRGALAGAKAPA